MSDVRYGVMQSNSPIYTLNWGISVFVSITPSLVQKIVMSKYIPQNFRFSFEQLQILYPQQWHLYHMAISPNFHQITLRSCIGKLALIFTQQYHFFVFEKPPFLTSEEVMTMFIWRNFHLIFEYKSSVSKVTYRFILQNLHFDFE